MSLLDKYLQGKVPIKLVRPENIIEKHKIKKILFLRNDRIGDLLVSEPVIRYFRQFATNRQIDVLLGEKNVSANSAVFPYVNKIFVYNKNIKSVYNLIKILKKEKYDLIVDLFDKPSRTSAIIMKLSKPKFTLGLDKENRLCYDFTVSRLNPIQDHIIDRTSQFLFALGQNPNELDLSPVFNISPEITNKIDNLPVFQHDNIFGINLAGSNRSKYWGESNYIQFIKELKTINPNYKVLIFFTKDYTEEANRISLETGAELVKDLNSFEEYAAGISKCKTLLTPDTSAVHLASAFKIKCLALYNQNFDNLNDSAPWLPYNTEFAYWGSKTGDLSEIRPEIVIEYLKSH